LRFRLFAVHGFGSAQSLAFQAVVWRWEGEVRALKDRAIYLYCFARSDRLRRLSAPGIDGGGQISTLALGGVGAVVSRISAADFREGPGESRLDDPTWVIPRACRHEQVIEEVMGCSPVLPLRFGTVFSSRRALKALLAERCQEIAAFLDSVADKEEWAVKGFVDLARAEASLLATDPVLRERCRRLPESPGARYLQEKRLRGEAATQAKLCCRTMAEQVTVELKSRALDMCPVRLQASSVSGRDAAMVLNCAFLLARSGVPRFRARVESMGSAYAEQGLALTLSGPWPPHNFCPSLGAPRGGATSLGLLAPGSQDHRDRRGKLWEGPKPAARA
jgi:hypothetical protein